MVIRFAMVGMEKEDEWAGHGMGLYHRRELKREKGWGGERRAVWVVTG
jgi:hypothetical protein